MVINDNAFLFLCVTVLTLSTAVIVAAYGGRR